MELIHCRLELSVISLSRFTFTKLLLGIYLDFKIENVHECINE